MEGGGGTEKTLLGHKFAGHAGATITLKYYGNEKLSPTRAMFASFSAKDNATMGRRRGLEGSRIYGTLFCKWTFLARERYREFKAR